MIFEKIQSKKPNRSGKHAMDETNDVVVEVASAVVMARSFGWEKKRDQRRKNETHKRKQGEKGRKEG